MSTSIPSSEADNDVVLIRWDLSIMVWLSSKQGGGEDVPELSEELPAWPVI